VVFGLEMGQKKGKVVTRRLGGRGWPFKSDFLHLCLDDLVSYRANFHCRGVIYFRVQEQNVGGSNWVWSECFSLNNRRESRLFRAGPLYMLRERV
jgi:hypothetical protein